MSGKKFNLAELIEQYRWYVGGLLLVLVLASGGWLVYSENRARLNTEQTLEMLDNRITDLENVRDIPTVTPTEASAPSAVTPEPQPEAGKVSGATTKSPVSSPTINGMININTATAEQLDSLPGIGTTYAKRIIEYRAANGSFKSIDEVKNVKGIGEKTFEKFRDKITVQ